MALAQSADDYQLFASTRQVRIRKGERTRADRMRVTILTDSPLPPNIYPPRILAIDEYGSEYTLPPLLHSNTTLDHLPELSTRKNQICRKRNKTFSSSKEFKRLQHRCKEFTFQKNNAKQINFGENQLRTIHVPPISKRNAINEPAKSNSNNVVRHKPAGQVCLEQIPEETQFFEANNGTSVPNLPPITRSVTFSQVSPKQHSLAKTPNEEANDLDEQPHVVQQRAESQQGRLLRDCCLIPKDAARSPVSYKELSRKFLAYQGDVGKQLSRPARPQKKLLEQIKTPIQRPVILSDEQRKALNNHSFELVLENIRAFQEAQKKRNKSLWNQNVNVIFPPQTVVPPISLMRSMKRMTLEERSTKDHMTLYSFEDMHHTHHHEISEEGRMKFNHATCRNGNLPHQHFVDHRSLTKLSDIPSLTGCEEEEETEEATNQAFRVKKTVQQTSNIENNLKAFIGQDEKKARRRNLVLKFHSICQRIALEYRSRMASILEAKRFVQKNPKDHEGQAKFKHLFDAFCALGFDAPSEGEFASLTKCRYLRGNKQEEERQKRASRAEQVIHDVFRKLPPR